MTTYDVGDTVALAVAVTDAVGAAADATAVTCTVTAPDGTTSTPAVAHPGLGSYSATYPATAAGLHVVSWAATGVNACAYTDSFTVADPAAVPVVSLAEAKRHLNITSSTSDEELRWMLTAAQDAGQAYTGRVFARRTCTDTLDPGTAGLLLTRTPVQSVTTVTVDGATVAAADYLLDAAAGIVYRVSGVWTGAGRGAVTVTYIAGPANPHPADRQGVLEMLRHLWTTQRGSMPALPRGADDYNPAAGYSVPRRVAELWDLRVSAGFA